MSADSPRRQSRGIAVPAIVPPQVVSDRSILDSAIGFISDVTLVAHQSHTEPKDTIIWARFETAADISDPCCGVDWEMEGNVAPPLLLLLGYGLGVQVWAIPANGEAIEVLSWRHGVVSTLRVLPTPASRSTDEHGRADETMDAYAEKRPLIALVDSNTASTQPQFCTLTFVSLKTGKQVKTIKFKNPILDVLANRSSLVAVFHERIAVFDARTLEDRLSITTCYPSPGINPNPVALGQRWLAYAEQKLIPSKRSGGGWDGEGIASYTATVLNAAKSFGKGLRELGEQVAAGLTGAASGGSISKNSSFDSSAGVEAKQPGIVTIIDIEQTVKDYSPTSTTSASGVIDNELIVAHFIAHSEAVVAMEFDNSGMLLLTADRRGHDFHVFRIQPHPVSSSLSAVHHLYVLHRGDTSAKVQNITFSLDSRWVAVSTLRGTTHVFPITPYGGAMGVRTHTSLHVVNKLSRFHRSAGLSAEGRSNSPISHSESTTFMQSLQPYHNTTLPPFPRPTVVLALAQLRQPFALGSPPGSAGLVMPGKISSSNSGTSNASHRQRHSSLSDDNGKPLSVCAIFAKSRSWLLEPPNVTREASHRIQRKAVDSLFVMAGHGALIQYDLDTKLASNIAKEKICDDTPIELEVEAKAQWNLGRRRDGSHELMPPLSNDNWLIKDRYSSLLLDSIRQFDDIEEKNESWVSQVEIITHAGPHRRLWMGPQCVFKTYNTPSGSNLNHVDVEAVEIGVSKSTSAAAAIRSHPLSMPVTAAARCTLPVLIESGSYSSIEQSPKLMDRFRHEHLDSDFAIAHGDSRLKEDLADAMRESPSVSEVSKNIVIAKEVDAELIKREKIQKSGKITQNLKTLNDPSRQNEKPIANVLTNEIDKNQQKEKCSVKQMHKESSSSRSHFPETKIKTTDHGKDTNKCSTTEDLSIKVRDNETKKSFKNIPSLEEEAIEFKRMTPLPVIKNRSQPALSDVKISNKPEITKLDKKNRDESKKFEIEKMKHTESNPEVHENKINESPQSLTLSKSIESSETLNPPELHTKLNTVCKTKHSVNTSQQKTKKVLEMENNVKSIDKSDNLSDNLVTKSVYSSEETNLKSENQMEDTTTNESAHRNAKTDIQKKCSLSDVPSSLDAKPAAKENDKNFDGERIYTIKIIDTTEAKKQNDPAKIKAVENKTLQDVNNKQNKHKKVDSKSSPAVVISPKKGSTKEQRDSNKTSNTQPEFGNLSDAVLESTKVVSSKSKNMKSKLAFENTVVSCSAEATPMIYKYSIAKDSVDGVKKSDNRKSEQDVNYDAINDEKKELPSLNAKSESFPSAQLDMPMNSVWKIVSSAPRVQPNIETVDNYPNLGAIGKNKKAVKNKESITEHTESNRKSEDKWSPSFEGFSALQPLESLPPLPTLEPLDMSPYSTLLKEKNTKLPTKAKDNLAEQLSLINFDSPLQENPRHDRKLPPALTQQNLIFALCGSLHYENDNVSDDDKPPTEHHITTNSGIGEQSTAEYKLLNENEEQYLSLEQSSQETNTTNTATTNEKCSSSANSSASEEIIVIEEKKLSKKQRRKRQQVESRKQQEESVTRDDDEELRPLIGMTDSHLEAVAASNSNVPSSSLSSLNSKDVQKRNSSILKPIKVASASPLAHSTTTTTDSEGPIPVTTSDDNIFILPSCTAVTNAPMKQKTKRLEHKINLMAAIDAATSSSTSSAEESNMETESRRTVSDPEIPIPGISTSQAQATATNGSLVTPLCTTKKKTKRRKR
ncbi:breast carcinoma-amplified sequence 3 homolog isoform X3 [Anastrepha obliqua]|uniref:breast carcinoma-amplified sequence 3 homolog isoform X3 n=1 Tax=Anastrepha obliqua TaxID=95512 RepID=UPI0024093601|nr:breast carcinoma-amplified sequence 3 homolog isoform X3 [Anastrepha obliqua]